MTTQGLSIVSPPPPRDLDELSTILSMMITMINLGPTLQMRNGSHREFELLAPSRGKQLHLDANSDLPHPRASDLCLGEGPWCTPPLGWACPPSGSLQQEWEAVIFGAGPEEETTAPPAP